MSIPTLLALATLMGSIVITPDGVIPARDATTDNPNWTIPAWDGSPLTWED